MNLYVYVLESEKSKDFGNQEALIWSEKGLIYGDWSSASTGYVNGLVYGVEGLGCRDDRPPSLFQCRIKLFRE
jgi:hypothetical protein